MKKAVKHRLITLIIVLGLSGFGISLLLYSMSDNIVFFYSPSEFKQKNTLSEVRIGGVVKEGSVLNISPDIIEFVITDYNHEIKVIYKGIVPTLFREKQGVVVLGTKENEIFIARNLLTKHDENYKPPIKLAD